MKRDRWRKREGKREGAPKEGERRGKRKGEEKREATESGERLKGAFANCNIIVFFSYSKQPFPQAANCITAFIYKCPP